MLGLVGVDDVVVVMLVRSVVDVVVVVCAADLVVEAAVFGVGERANECLMVCCDMDRSRWSGLALGVANEKGGMTLADVAGVT